MEMVVSHFTLFALLLSFNFMKSTFGMDTLVPNQTISIAQTLISHNQDFVMGFFTPGKSQKIYLGIWYKNTPDVVVWVANRNHPISDPQGVTLVISGEGAVVISRVGRIIWSANPSGPASNPVLQLLDTGNLVLVNQTMEGSSQSYLWQSFDYPTDTHLPKGMKLVNDSDSGTETYLRSWKSWDDPSPGDFVLRIENQGLPEVVVYRGEKKIHRSGKWNGLQFNAAPLIPNPLYDSILVFKQERLISVLGPNSSSIVTRGLIDPSGTIRSYVMNAQKDNWNCRYTFPRDQCDQYGLCGPNAICRIDKLVLCECLSGFAPKFPKDWDRQDWSGGCSRITPLNCGSGDGMLEFRQVKYPDMLKFWMNTSMSLKECKDECLKNCSCTACANQYVTNGGHGCVLWFGDLIDIRHFSAADSKQNMYVRVAVSELVDYHKIDIQKQKKQWPTRLILMSIASGVVISGFINGGIFMITRRKKQATLRSNELLELPIFKFATIVAATNSFSRENMLGEGGFGRVYKGVLSSGEEIAIIRLSTTSGQGLQEFKNEVTLIAKLQHTNLVRILGCCIEGEERMLIYEYLPNKSLDYFVFDQSQRNLLTWPIRFDIIMGIARGLLYLHRDSRLKIIHRDLKTSNILLDGNFNPKISDFGLARTFGEHQPLLRTRRVAGTFGYMSPEYALAGNYSVKSDIFSLGVVLLEIVSGKKNRGFECRRDHYHSHLAHAWLLWKENKILELMDECLKDSLVESQVKRCIHVGLLCVQKNAEDRPEMSSVLFMLGTDEAILPHPKEPGFFIGTTSTPERSSTPPIPTSERNTITITDLEAR